MTPTITSLEPTSMLPVSSTYPPTTQSPTFATTVLPTLSPISDTPTNNPSTNPTAITSHSPTTQSPTMSLSSPNPSESTSTNPIAVTSCFSTLAPSRLPPTHPHSTLVPETTPAQGAYSITDYLKNEGTVIIAMTTTRGNDAVNIDNANEGFNSTMIVFAALGAVLLVVIIFCTCKASKWRVKGNDHPSGLEYDDKEGLIANLMNPIMEIM